MAAPDYAALNKKYKTILVAFEDAVLTITFNRSKQLNSVTQDVKNDIVHIFDLADRDDRVRVVILTADLSSPAYCAGADLTKGWDVIWVPESEKEGEHAHRDLGGQISLPIYNCRKLTIAAVNGHATGAGMTAFQLPFDFRFIWAGAKLTFPFVSRGITAEAVSSYMLPRLLGHSRANSLMLSGSTVSPNSHLISALYHEIIPKREDVYPAAKAFAKELAANTAQVSVAYTKALLRHPGDSAEENHLLDSLGMKLLARSADGQEGVQAFLEKRKPKFTDTLSQSSLVPWWRTVDVNHRKSKL